MNKKVKYFDDRPIVVYDTIKKQPIGIFSTHNLAIRYLYPNQDSGRKASSISHALKDKNKLSKTIFDFKVCIRYANEEQTEILNNNKYKILNNYPEPPENEMLGFHTTKGILYTMGNEKHKRRTLEECNKRKNDLIIPY